jgi:hypothetical protein
MRALVFTVGDEKFLGEGRSQGVNVQGKTIGFDEYVALAQYLQQGSRFHRLNPSRPWFVDCTLASVASVLTAFGRLLYSDSASVASFASVREGSLP